MQQVNMHDAKSRLSELVQLVESGEETEVVIARNGRPVARLLAVTPTPDVGRRIGVARDRFRAPDPDPEFDREVASLFVADGGRKRRTR